MSSKAVLIVGAGAIGIYLFRSQIENALGVNLTGAASPLITPPPAPVPVPSPTAAAQATATNVIAAGGTPTQAAIAAQQASTTVVVANLLNSYTEAQLAQASIDPVAAAALDPRILLNVSQWNYYRKIANPSDTIFLAPTSVGDGLITAPQYLALRTNESGSLGGVQPGQWRHNTALRGPRAAWR